MKVLKMTVLAMVVAVSGMNIYNSQMESKNVDHLTLENVEGVRVLTPHCCRHTYVSQMQALGVSMETIQSIVGHADAEMTKKYLHVQENIRQEAIARFNEAFSRNGKGTFGNILDYKKSS